MRAWLARQVAATDPEAVRRRRKKALRARRVWIQPEPDGMATIGAYLSAEEAQACWNALTAGASNIDGAVDPARADVFVALLTGLTVGEPVPVQVILTGSGPELSGHGAISRSHSAELCKGTDLIDLTRPPKPSTGYRLAPTLARWVRARDRHCRFPGYRRPAVMCDLDHVIPHPSGPHGTYEPGRLVPVSPPAEDPPPWSVQMLDGAVLRWTSPRGHVFPPVSMTLIPRSTAHHGRL